MMPSTDDALVDALAPAERRGSFRGLPAPLLGAGNSGYMDTPEAAFGGDE